MPRMGLRSSTRAGLQPAVSINANLSSNVQPFEILTPQDSPRSAFMEIHPEIRLLIYEYVFDGTQVFYDINTGIEPKLLPQVIWKTYDVLKTTKNHNALLMVSKHIHLEAFPLYHHRTTFVLSRFIAARSKARFQLHYLFKNIKRLIFLGFHLKNSRKLPKFENLEELVLMMINEPRVNEIGSVFAIVPDTHLARLERLSQHFNLDSFMTILNTHEYTSPTGSQITAFKAKLPETTRLTIRFNYRYIYDPQDLPDCGDSDDDTMEVVVDHDYEYKDLKEVYTSLVTYDVGLGRLTWSTPKLQPKLDWIMEFDRQFSVGDAGDHIADGLVG